MKVIVESIEQGNLVNRETGVILFEDDGAKRNPCAWTYECPVGKYRDYPIDCKECPARYIDRKVSFQEAMKFWKKAEING